LDRQKGGPKGIRSVKDCIARAGWECRNNRRSLLRTCHWIRAFHENKSGNAAASWADHKMARELKRRLGLALREMHSTGVAPKEGMPEPEEILAFRICSPYPEFNATVAGLLFDLGYLHYGSRCPCSHATPDNVLPLNSDHSSSKTNDEDEPAVVTEDLLLTTANTIKSSHNDLKQVVAAHYEEHGKTLEDMARKLDHAAVRTTQLERQCTHAKELADETAATAKAAKEASAAAAVDASKAWATALELTQRVEQLLAKLEADPVAADTDSTAVATPAEADSGSATTANANITGRAGGATAEDDALPGCSAASQPATTSGSRNRNVDEAAVLEELEAKRAATGAEIRRWAHVANGKKTDMTAHAAHQRRSVMENWTMD
jgi:hypothetical protein